jgi:beta-glucanase (GH16 family)
MAKEKPMWRRHVNSSLQRPPAAGSVLFVLLIGAWGPGARGAVVTDNPDGWKLTFRDEFSGTALDESKWAYRQTGPRHDGVNTPDAVSVRNDLLTIATYTEGGVHYTGMISTQGKFEQAYGYFEARMKFHSTPGQWSAFWVQSPTYGSPLGNPAKAGTEIDVVEHRAANKKDANISKWYSSAVHWDGYGDAHQQVAHVHNKLRRMGNDSWHAYGLKWSPGGYEFYYDDKLVWKTDKSVSRRPEYVILSSEVRNGAWAGSIPAKGYGTREASVTNVQVDYVRIYEAVPSANPPADRNGDAD